MYREKTCACSLILCPISIFSWIQFEMSTVSWAIKIRFCKRFIVLWALTGANNLSYLFTSNVDFREIIDLLIWLKSLICKELREREVLIKYIDSIVNNLQKKICFFYEIFKNNHEKSHKNYIHWIIQPIFGRKVFLKIKIDLKKQLKRKFGKFDTGNENN